MQAEDLADGKHQKSFVCDVATQFGELMLYVERLEEQRDNLKKAYTKLLNVRVGKTNQSVIHGGPYGSSEYW